MPVSQSISLILICNLPQVLEIYIILMMCEIQANPLKREYEAAQSYFPPSFNHLRSLLQMHAEQTSNAISSLRCFYLSPLYMCHRQIFTVIGNRANKP